MSRHAQWKVAAVSAVALLGAALTAMGEAPLGGASPAPPSTPAFRSVCPLAGLPRAALSQPGDGGPPILASIDQPVAVASDAAGNVYVVEAGRARVRRIDAARSTITTVAGGGSQEVGDGGPATDVRLHGPRGLAVEPDGSALYVSEGIGGYAIRRVDLVTGVISTIAGTVGVPRSVGDPLSGSASTLRLGAISALALAGTVLYLGDGYQGDVQALDLVNRTLTHVASDVTRVDYVGSEPVGVPVPALERRLGPITGLAWDPAGRLFIADQSTIEVLDVAAGTIAHYAFSGVGFDQFPTGSATLARGSNGLSIAWDGTRLQVADARMNVIRSVDGAGVVQRTAGDTVAGLADGPGARFALPYGIGMGPGGALLVADTQNSAVRSVDVATGFATTLAGGSPQTGAPISTTIATDYDLGSISGVAVDDQGVTYVSSAFASRIYAVGTDQRIRNFAGSGAVRGEYPPNWVDGEVGLSHAFARVGNLRFVAEGGRRWLYAVEVWDPNGGRRLVRIDLDDPQRRVRTVTGADIGDGAPAVSDGAVGATAYFPGTISDYAVDDRNGDVYVAEGFTGTVWRIDAATGLVRRFAGNGVPPAAAPPDGTPRLDAALGFVWALAWGPGHTLYLGTSRGQRQVYAVTGAGTLTRVAGLDSTAPAISGDGGPALAAVIAPTDLVVAKDGALVLADSTVVRRVAMTSPFASGTIESALSPAGGAPLSRVRDELPALDAVDGNASHLDVAPDGSIVLAADALNSGDESVMTTVPTPGRLHLVRRLTSGGCALATASVSAEPILSRGAPVHAADIPFEGIPADSLAAAALQTSLASTPLRNSGPAATPLRNSSIAALPLRNSSAPRVSLASVPFVDGRSWVDVLAETPLAGVPVQNLTLNEVVALAASGEPHLAAITLADVDLAASPLRNSSVASIALGSTTLSQLPGADPPEADPYATTWCPYLRSVGLSCDELSGSSTFLDLEVRTAPLRNSPLRNSPLRNSPLRNSDLSASPLRNSPLRNSPLRNSPLRNSPLRNSALGTAAIGAIPLTSVPLRNSDLDASPLRNSPLRNSASPALLDSVVDCARVDCSASSGATLGDAASLSPSAIRPGATVADLFAAFAATTADAWTLGDLREYGSATIGDIAPTLPASYTVADAILAVIPAGSLAWEAVGTDALGLAGLGAAPAVDLVAEFDIGPARDTGATRVVVTLPAGASFVTKPQLVATLVSVPVPGFSDISITVATTISGRTLTATIPPVVPGARRYRLTVPVTATRPPSEPISVNVLGITRGDLGLSAATTSISPVDEVASPPPLEPTATDGDLVVGSISVPGDVDTITVPVPPVPGAVTEVSLSGADVDLDLTAYQPSIRPPMSARSYRTNGLKTPPLEASDPELAGIDQLPDPQVLRDLPVAGGDPTTVMSVSARRGVADEKVSVVSRAGDQGVYRFQVSGYAGAASPRDYLLVVRQRIPAGAGACPPREVTAAAPAASTGTITTATRALFLVNESRMLEVYGAAAYSAMRARLDAVAARPEVAGAVIAVDGDPAVRASYAAWDAAPCDADRANQVVGAIESLVDRLQGPLPGTGAKALTSLTLVGSDVVLPQARVADGTKDSNELQYAADTARADVDGASVGPSPLSSAQAARSVLTDDAYVDWDPYAWRDGALFIPDIAVGRLVEKPSEISVALEGYLDNVTSPTVPANLRGRLTAASALTTGYDFLSDGASAVDAALGARVAQRSTLIDDAWTRGDLASRLYPSGASPEVASINAHFDHHQLLPAAGNASGDSSDLFTTADVASRAGRLRGRLIFSMGCHSGLSVPDGYLTGSATDLDATVDPAPLPGEPASRTAARAARLDWAEAFAADGAVFVGNTGYGYGDSATIAFSERLMTQFATALDGTLPAGTALVQAKNEYYRTAQLAFSDYDHKVLQESTFYGLPFWGVGEPATPPALPTPVATAPDPATGGVAATPKTFTPSFSTPTGPGGLVPTADGRPPLVVDGQPVTARTDADVTPADANLEVHGFLITSLSSVDQPAATVAFGNAVIDDATNERATPADGAVFPSSLASTAVVPSTRGPRQFVDVAVSQFIDDPTSTSPGRGTIRRFTNVGGQVLYAPRADADGIAPVIIATSATTNGGGVRFDVTTSDTRRTATGAIEAGTVQRVVVMYRDGGTWRTADLARGPADALGEHFAGSVGATSPDIEYFVQAVDASGNVGVSSNKATLFDAVASPVANLAPAPSLTQGVSATAGVPVTIGGRFSDPDGPVPATARIDLGAGAGFQPLAITAGAGGGTFTTTATYPTAGPRTVTVEVCDAALACGRATTTVGVVLRVNQAPSVSISPTASIGVTSTNIPIRITYADADGPTPRTMAIDLGTGAGFQPVSPVPSSGATRNLRYSVPGQYEVRVRVCDALGACGTATTQVLVLSGLGSAGKVVPILDCVKVSGSTMITRWGYRNTASSTVNLPIGLGNFVVPSPSNRGQPTSFPTGERHEVFTVTTTGWYVAWVLNGRLAVAIRGAVPAGVRTCS